MRTFTVVTDSTSDLGKDLREKYNILYTPMNYVIDEAEYPAMLDWESHSAKDFYDMMRKGVHIRTTQVPRDTYMRTFTKILESGNDVLYISCSSALSGSINIARVVAKELMESYPDAKICCVDSLISSLGQGYLVMQAAQMCNDGKSVEETAAYIESIRLKENQFGTVGSLEYLRRAGRVTASSAFFGNLFGVKPIIISDKIGQNLAVKKVKGALNAKKEIAAMLAEATEDAENQTLYITHADALEEAEQLRDEILKVAPFKDSYINYIAPIVGASVGPGTIIAFGFGKEVTVEGGK